MVHLIIAGHGKQRNGTFDPGATGFIKKGEHRYVVDDLFPAMKKYLPKKHNVVFFNKYKVSDYGNIATLAKEYKATQITEVHFDAAVQSARGGHVIVYGGYSPDKMDLSLRNAIKAMVGVRYSHKGHSGISGRKDLLNVNVTAKAGITYRLIELGFGTNKADADIMTNQVDTYAKELVKAVVGGIASDHNEQEKTTKVGEEQLNLSETEREEIARIFKHAREKGIFQSRAQITSDSQDHEKHILNGTMSLSRLQYLQTIVAGAGINSGKRIK